MLVLVHSFGSSADWELLFRGSQATTAIAGNATKTLSNLVPDADNGLWENLIDAFLQAGPGQSTCSASAGRSEASRRCAGSISERNDRAATLTKPALASPAGPGCPPDRRPLELDAD